MAMKRFTPDDQRVANLSSDDQNDDLIPFYIYIIEHAEFPHPEFELGEWIGAQTLDGPGRRGRCIT
jgi:hypothetical protein